MLERVQRAWDRLHHRPLLYRRVGSDDATAEETSEDWQPMMTASLYCPGPDGEPVVDCRHRKPERRSSTDAARSVGDDGGWCTLTLDRAELRCRCAVMPTDRGDHATWVPLCDSQTDAVRRKETLPRFKSPVLGRRLRSLVADDHPANVASGSSSCPGSPRDVARLSAVVGRRLQLGLSPRLSPRRTHRRADLSVNVNCQQPRQVFNVRFHVGVEV